MPRHAHSGEFANFIVISRIFFHMLFRSATQFGHSQNYISRVYRTNWIGIMHTATATAVTLLLC